MGSETDSLRVNAARADITPSTLLPLFGRARRSGAARTIASRLEANVLLFDAPDGPAAIIAIDSLYASQQLEDEVRRQTAARGLSFSQGALLFVASHTHNAPSLDPTKPRLGPFDVGYLDFAAARITEALLVARSQHNGVARVAHGQALCAASTFRRRAVVGIDLARLRVSKRVVMAPDARVAIDQRLKLLLLSGADQTPRAVLWSWPCHAVSEPDAMALSADFPGALRGHIRNTLGVADLPVLYFPGFSGDIRPASRPFVPLHRSATWIGVGPRFAPASAAAAATLHAALARAFDAAFALRQDAGGLSQAMVRRQRRHLALDTIRTDAGSLAPLICDDWAIGPIRIMAVSAEVAAAYAPRSGRADPLTFVTGCAGQVFGYVPTDSQIHEGGYEVNGFATDFSVPGRFRDQIERAVFALIEQQVQDGGPEA